VQTRFRIVLLALESERVRSGRGFVHIARRRARTMLPDPPCCSGRHEFGVPIYCCVVEDVPADDLGEPLAAVVEVFRSRIPVRLRFSQSFRRNRRRSSTWPPCSSSSPAARTHCRSTGPCSSILLHLVSWPAWCRGNRGPPPWSSSRCIVFVTSGVNGTQPVGGGFVGVGLSCSVASLKSCFRQVVLVLECSSGKRA